MHSTVVKLQSVVNPDFLTLEAVSDLIIEFVRHLRTSKMPPVFPSVLKSLTNPSICVINRFQREKSGLMPGRLPKAH
jgi:hypothetical protein